MTSAASYGDTHLDGVDMPANSAGGSEGDANSASETSEVQQARAQAASLSQAAVAARARYARLVQGQGGQVLEEEQELHTDMLGDSAAMQDQRLGRTEMALAASTVVEQLTKSFPQLASNPIIETALPWAPLLLLSPQRRGSGLTALATDPRVWSGVAVAGIALTAQRSRVKALSQIRISRFHSPINQGSTHKFLVDAYDEDGRLVPAQGATFTTSDPNVVTVNDQGVVQAVNQGNATITVTLDGKSDLVQVGVN